MRALACGALEALARRLARQQQQAARFAAAAGAAREGGGARLGPAARLLLASAELAAEAVRGTGPRGIVTKGDALAAVAASREGGARPAAAAAAPTSPPPEPPRAVAAPAAAAAPRAAGVDVPASQMRRAIAARLLESKQTLPHEYARVDVDLAAVQAFRAALKAQGGDGPPVSLNDCVVKAAALALRAVPAVNARWDAAAGAAAPGAGVDVAVAVATAGGLVTPVLRGADAKPLAALAGELRELAARARAGRLLPEEYSNGSFSVSNLGMYGGVDAFFAVINPPQGAILAVGGARSVAAVGAGGAPEARTVIAASLSADGRVVDGAAAGAFLDAFRQAMENPYSLLS